MKNIECTTFSTAYRIPSLLLLVSIPSTLIHIRAARSHFYFAGRHFLISSSFVWTQSAQLHHRKSPTTHQYRAVQGKPPITLCNQTAFGAVGRQSAQETASIGRYKLGLWIWTHGGLGQRGVCARSMIARRFRRCQFCNLYRF